MHVDAGNLLTQYALAFVGLSVTETVESSITVVMGAPGVCLDHTACVHLTSAVLALPAACLLKPR